MRTSKTTLSKSEAHALGSALGEGCALIGCACAVRLALYAAIVAGVVLAARWALASHAFGL